MKLNSIFRMFVKGSVPESMPKVQEEARRLGLDNKAVVLDANRKETRVDCNIKNGQIIPVIPGFMPQVINYGLPAVEGTAAVVIDIHREGKLETKVFKPKNSFLFFRSGMVFNLWNRLLEVFYLGAEKKVEENKEACWCPVYKPIFQYALPSYVMNDSQMREHLREKLSGKVLESHLQALNELTLNPAKSEKRPTSHKDEVPNHGVDISGKSSDGLPGTVRATADPPADDELEDKSSKTSDEVNNSNVDRKANGKSNKSGDEPKGKPKSETKSKSNRHVLADVKAGVMDEAAE